MKPIIIVTGFPHSFTSATAKFLIQNGGYCPDLWDRPNIKYKTYESKEINHYTWLRENQFKPSDLTKFFTNLPLSATSIIKAPMAGKYLNEFRRFTNREIRVVYCLRNIDHAILSNIEKNPHRATYEEYVKFFSQIYRGVSETVYNVFPLLTERFLYKDDYTVKNLLKFCDLKPKIINFTDIKPPTRTIDLIKRAESKKI